MHFGFLSGFMPQFLVSFFLLRFQHVQMRSFSVSSGFNLVFLSGFIWGFKLEFHLGFLFEVSFRVSLQGFLQNFSSSFKYVFQACRLGVPRDVM